MLPTHSAIYLSLVPSRTGTAGTVQGQQLLRLTHTHTHTHHQPVKGSSSNIPAGPESPVASPRQMMMRSLEHTLQTLQAHEPDNPTTPSRDRDTRVPAPPANPSAASFGGNPYGGVSTPKVIYQRNSGTQPGAHRELLLRFVRVCARVRA